MSKWQQFLDFHKTTEGYILKEQDNHLIQMPDQNIPISANVNHNFDKIKEFMSYPDSGDLIVRWLKVVLPDRTADAFIFYFDGLSSRDNIGHFVLRPLMQATAVMPPKCGEIEYISRQLITQNDVIVAETYEKAIDLVCFGGCGIFVDGIARCYVADVKGWEKRSLSKPTTEGSILGPQEGFTELIRMNTALIRKTIKDSNLVIENAAVGRKSKTPCAILYIKNLANDSLIAEIKERMEKVDADYIFTSEELENFLEDSNLRLVPQIFATERVDRAAMEICDGNVVVMVNGSPFALVMPATFFTFMKTPDSHYMRLPYANLLQIVRYIALAVSVLLPGLFIVITQYHHEMIPTSLLYALEASFEMTPFPTIVELIALEIAFELIREAEIKFPSIGGPSIGIVGALILGQAAVSANIVSPIIIIIVALTAVGSLSTPNYNLGITFRIMKFVYIIFSAAAGFLGFTVCLFLHLVMLCTTKSFGVRFLSPVAPRNREGFWRTIFVGRDYKKTSKPDYNNSKQEPSEHYHQKGSKGGGKRGQ